MSQAVQYIRSWAVVAEGSNLKSINILAASNGDLSMMVGIGLDVKGVISVTRNDGVTGRVAEVAVAWSTNEDRLKYLSGLTVDATGISGPAQIGNPSKHGIGDVKQGALEQHNFNITAELLRLRHAQQAYKRDT